MGNILGYESKKTFELDPEEEAQILAAIAEAERGEFVNASDLLKRISIS